MLENKDPRSKGDGLFSLSDGGSDESSEFSGTNDQDGDSDRRRPDGLGHHSSKAFVCMSSSSVF